MSPILDSIGSVKGYGWASIQEITFPFDSIATYILSSDQSSFTFSSIPSGYNNLQIRALVKTNRATYSNDGIRLRFNGDTGNNYRCHFMYSTGDNAKASGNALGTSIPTIAAASGGNSAYDNMFGVIIVDIVNYNIPGRYKTVKTLNGIDAGNGTGNSVGISTITSGLWLNNDSAINSITIFPELGSQFKQNSHFALYGIKNTL